MSEVTRPYVPRRVWYSVVMSYAVSIVIAASTLIYARHIDTQSNQQWCYLVNILDNTYHKSPPTTEAGKQIAGAIHNLRSNFEC